MNCVRVWHPRGGAVEEAAVIEKRLLSGFMRDRYLLGRAMEAGFRPDLMPHALGRTLAKVLARS